MPKKDKYACFQWIRDVRDRRNREMEGMTPEECSDYINAKGDEALRRLPKMTEEERERILYEAIYSTEPLTPPKPKRKASVAARASKTAGKPLVKKPAAKKPATRRKTAKRPAHA